MCRLCIRYKHRSSMQPGGGGLRSRQFCLSAGVKFVLLLRVFVEDNTIITIKNDKE